MAKMKKYHSGSMIKNDNSKIANMPQDVVMKQYPYPGMLEESYEDTIDGIDQQMAENGSGLKKQYAPHKW